MNPYVHDFKAYDFWLKPIGLLKIASILVQNHWEVEFIDLLDRNHPILKKHKIETKRGLYGKGKFPAQEIEKPKIYKDVPRKYKRYGIPLKLFREILEEIEPPSLVLVTTGMTYWYPGVRETVLTIKEYFPDAFVILGGIYATLLPEHASSIGFVLPGSFENNIQVFSDITESSLTLPTKIYLYYEAYSKLEYVVLETSKGCPFNCSYCATSIINPSFTFKKPESAVEEIMYYKERFKVDNFAFYDDALLSNPYFKDILKTLVKKGEKLIFHTPNGINPSLITQELAELMYEAGFSSLYLSLETVDDELQKRTGGKLTKRLFERGVEFLKKAGFKEGTLHSYIIAGLPGQSEESIIKTIDFSLELGVIPHIAEYSPIPGTPEYKKTGLKNTDDPLLHNNTSYPYIFKTYNIERLKTYLNNKRKRGRL